MDYQLTPGGRQLNFSEISGCGSFNPPRTIFQTKRSVWAVISQDLQPAGDRYSSSAKGSWRGPIASAVVHLLHFSDSLAITISSSQSVLSFFKLGLVSISGETCKGSINKIKYSLLCCNWFQVCEWYSSSPAPTLQHSLCSYLELQAA